MDLLVGDAEDSRNGRPANIDVHNPRLAPRTESQFMCCVGVEYRHTHLSLLVCGKGPGELRGESALANASLAAKDEELVFHVLHAFFYERESRIGSLWLVCGTDILVCTSCTRICLAGLLRLDALEERRWSSR